MVYSLIKYQETEGKKVRRLGYDLSVARLQQEAYTLGITKSVNAMTQAEKAQLRYYAIMTQVTDAQGDMARTIQAPANQLRIFRAQVIQLARALGNILVPVLNAVLPYVIAFVKVMRMALEQIAALLHIELPQFDIVDAVVGMKSVEESADGTADGLGKAAKKMKELKNATLGIDELNVISPPEPDSGSGRGAGAGVGGLGGDLGIKLPGYDFLRGLKGEGDKMVEKVKRIIGVLESIVLGALFTIGVVMCILGHPKYGIPMIIAGAVGMGVMTINGSKLPNTVKKALAQVMSIVGGMAIALGAFLIAVGSLPVGAALVVAGAGMLVGAISLNFGLAKGKVKNFLLSLMQVVSGGLLVLGVCLLWLGGTLPLALSMIAVGAVGLVTSLGLNFNLVQDKMKEFFGQLGIIIGTGLLAIGVVLVACGVTLPLGIALIAAGVASMVSQVAINWETIKNKVKETFESIKNVAGTLGLIALGLMLCFTGVGIPLGMSLIKKGASQFGTGETISWDSMTTKLHKKLEEMKGKLRKWEADFKSAPVKIQTALSNKWKSIKSWFLDRFGTDSISLKIDFIKGKLKGGWGKIKNKLLSYIGLASTGGVVTPYGIQQFAGGGFGRHGRMNSWNGIPMYGMGGGVHGSMFMAGENGAELVGHVGGQTEVLNRSQIGSVMLNAVVTGMAQFLPAWNGIYAQVAAMREENLSDNVTYRSSYNSSDSDGYTLKQFAEEFMPLMRSTENSARTQADKDGNITVRIGAREINNEITRQNKANGFVFAE